MKKNIKWIIILFICIGIILGTNYVQEATSRYLVEHKEAGNFINIDDINMERITMLHWFAKEVEIYSKTKEDVYITIYNPYHRYILYKNRSLLLQNMSSDYPKYQNGKFVMIHLDKDDYIENRINFYGETEGKQREGWEENGVYLIGNYYMITKFISIKQSVDTAAFIFLCLFSIGLIVIGKKDTTEVIMALSALVFIFDIKLGVILFLCYIYMYAETLYKKRYRKVLTVLMFIVWWLPNVVMVFFTGFLLIASSMKYRKKQDKKSLVSLIFITCIMAVLCMEIEFSVFKIFYTDFILFIINAYFLVRIVGRFLGNDRMVEIELLRGFSHDIRLPLATVKLNIDMLEKDDFTAEIKKEQVYHSIHNALHDLTKMTTSLTAYISKDKYIDKKYKTSINDAILSSVDYFIHNEKNIDIQVNMIEEQVYLPIERVWLSRMIYNLLDNSYKYTNEYGIIDIKLYKKKRKIVISVEDNGIGMTSEEVQHVLEPFYKGDKARGKGGLGLGLAVVKSIVINLEGDIRIETKKNVGTKVIIEI